MPNSGSSKGKANYSARSETQSKKRTGAGAQPPGKVTSKRVLKGTKNRNTDAFYQDVGRAKRPDA